MQRIAEWANVMLPFIPSNQQDVSAIAYPSIQTEAQKMRTLRKGQRLFLEITAATTRASASWMRLDQHRHCRSFVFQRYSTILTKGEVARLSDSAALAGLEVQPAGSRP